MKSKESVLLAMSGGVDSLCSAILLQDKGYHVIGVTFVNWNERTKGIKLSAGKPTPLQASLDAAQLCKTLGIEHHSIDLSTEFEEVIDYFSDSYMKGETPNPCIFCNRHFKFKYLKEYADKLQIHWISTGHYAGIKHQAGRYYLYRALDDWKDQTFMLWALSQDILSRCIFPLTDIKKEEVKRIVSERGFEYQASNRESFNLCFVPDDDYRQFLIRRNPEHFGQLNGGIILDKRQQEIGKHEGYPFYTIGQSKGIQLNIDGKYYIYKIVPGNNTLKVADKQTLYQAKIQVRSLNFQKYETLKGNYRFFVRIRGKDIGTYAKITFENKVAHVYFEQPVFAPAPGQSAVFYENKEVVCGGIISKLFYERGNSEYVN